MEAAATILVFGDNTAVLELVEQTLRVAGHRVLTTGDAAEVVEVGRSVRIDLLITEVVFGATALAEQLRAIQSGVRVLYIFDRNHPDPTDAGHVLRKPISLDELSATVTAVLQGGRETQ